MHALTVCTRPFLLPLLLKGPGHEANREPISVDSLMSDVPFVLNDRVIDLAVVILCLNEDQERLFGISFLDKHMLCPYL